VRLSRAAYYRPPRSRLLRDTDVVTALNDVVARHSRWAVLEVLLSPPARQASRVHRVYCAPAESPAAEQAARARAAPAPDSSMTVRAREGRPSYRASAMKSSAQVSFKRVGAASIDEGNREALAIEIGTSIPSARVIRVLDELVRLYGRPARVRVDNGP